MDSIEAKQFIHFTHSFKGSVFVETTKITRVFNGIIQIGFQSGVDVFSLAQVILPCFVVIFKLPS